MLSSFQARLAFGLVVFAVLLLAVWSLPLLEWLEQARTWAGENPVASGAVFLIAFIAGSVLLLPGSLLCMSGGYLFGLYIGVPLVCVGSALGATATCFVTRRFARNAVIKRFDHDPRFHAIDRAIRSKALSIVVLTRLSLLIPYNVLNLIYGLTRIPLLTLTLGSLVGMVPAVVLYVYVGSIARNVDQLLSGELETGMSRVWLVAFGLVAVAIVAVVIHRTATRELQRELARNADDSTAEADDSAET